MICPPIFRSRKNTQVLAGCAQTPTLFPPALLHQVHHLNTAQLSTLSTSSYHSKTSAFVWFASFQISLFWVSTDSYLQSGDLVCIRKLPLCAGVSDPTIESEVDTFDQLPLWRPSSQFRRVLVIAGKSANCSARLVHPCDFKSSSRHRILLIST